MFLKVEKKKERFTCKIFYDAEVNKRVLDFYE